MRRKCNLREQLVNTILLTSLLKALTAAKAAEGEAVLSFGTKTPIRMLTLCRFLAPYRISSDSPSFVT